MKTTRTTFASPLDLTSMDENFRQRFWSKVNIGAPDACWEWTARRQASGYGQFTVRKGVFMTASRVSLALTIGRPLEAGEVACHRCDNPPCVNPTHLFAGTQSVNALDCVDKGRAIRAVGEATYSNKLAEAEVIEIRAATHYYGLHANLARHFNVSAHTIHAIRSGATWKSLAWETEHREYHPRDPAMPKPPRVRSETQKAAARERSQLRYLAKRDQILAQQRDYRASLRIEKAVS